MLKALRKRIQQWFTSRLPRTDLLELTQRNIYVLPTGVCLFLCITLLALLVASINYQANLGFMLTFMLAGSAFISILVGHATLRGLHARLHPIKPVFAGQNATLTIDLQAPDQRTRYSIEVSSQEATQAPAVHGSDFANAATQTCNIMAGQCERIELPLAAMPRGIHACPRLTLQTHYPIGTFRTWAVWLPATRLMVYPAPEPNAPPLPRSFEPGKAGAASAITQSFEPDGTRIYQRGDPIKTILWKKTATAMATGHGEWVRRDQTELNETRLWLDHAQTGLSQPEAILSRLCAWVLEAEKTRIAYGLRLAHLEIPIGTGEAHFRLCLQKLAES